MRCGRPGKVASPRAISARRQAAMPRRAGMANAAFCALCGPCSEPMPARSPSTRRARRLVMASIDLTAAREITPGSVRATPTPESHRPSRPDQRRQIASAVCVVDADHARSRAGDEPRLRRGVVLHRAVAVEMIGREVEQDPTVASRRGRQVDLVATSIRARRRGSRRAARATGSRCRYCRPSARRCRPLRRMWCDQRRGGRLAVGAGDADERRVRRKRCAARGEQLDVADHLDAGRCASLDAPVRLGMR